MSLEEIEKHFDLDRLKTVPELNEALAEKLETDTRSLAQFIGVVARLHNFINARENAAYFQAQRRSFHRDTEEF